MAEGYIKQWRSILEWEWWHDLATFRLFSYLLLAASYTEETKGKITLRAGQLITTYPELSEQTDLSIKQVRTAIAHLKETGEIVTETTNKFTIVTIQNWEHYQGAETKGRQNVDKKAVKKAGRRADNYTHESALDMHTNDHENNYRGSQKGRQEGSQKGRQNADKKNSFLILNKEGRNIMSFSSPTQADFDFIVDCLNQHAGTHFRSTTQKTKDLIKARYNEGYVREDFEQVIKIKCAEWKEDPYWSRFLRPETLFGNKFEGYLNQPMPYQSGKKTESDNLKFL